MNYIKHLTGFFERIMLDRNLNPTHISLYIALFQFWNINRFQNPISISRDEVMQISKISSKATYHKCMRDLNDKGYVKYEPSYNPYRGSLVTLFDFTAPLKLVQKKANSPKKILPPTEQAMNKQPTSSDTSNEQALVSSINMTNYSNMENDLNLEEQAKTFEDEHLFFEEKEEKKLREKKKPFCFNSSAVEQPALTEVQSYFHQQNFPALEAHKFFNYFSSVGWLIGGKIPIVDWQASAQNWMLNAIKFKTTEKPLDRAKHLNVGNEKDYGEPL